MRRAHLNDMENILPFLILGFLYMFTNPAYATALLCYRSVRLSQRETKLMFFLI